LKIYLQNVKSKEDILRLFRFFRQGQTQTMDALESLYDEVEQTINTKSGAVVPSPTIVG
jgi:hypothetical protein